MKQHLLHHQQDARATGTATSSRHTASCGGYGSATRSSSPARRSQSIGPEFPVPAAAAPASRAQHGVSGSSSAIARAQSTSPSRFRGLFGYSSSLAGRRSLGPEPVAAASMAAPAPGAGAGALPARCRSASPAALRGRGAASVTSAAGMVRGDVAGASSSDRSSSKRLSAQHQQRQQPASSSSRSHARPPGTAATAAAAGAAAGSSAPKQKVVGGYDRPWRSNMKPVTHRAPSPARAQAATVMTAAPSTPPGGALGGGGAAAAAVAIHMLAADADGQPYVVKSKRRTAEEHAALQVCSAVCVPDSPG